MAFQSIIHGKSFELEANMKKFWWVILIVVVLLASGFLGYRVLAAKRAASAAATNLQTATVQQGNLISYLNSVGTVRTGQSAVIDWQTSGKVGSISVNLGDQVQANQELAALDQNSLAPSMINAKQNLIDAKKSLDDLLNSKTQQAQALQAVQTAQQALDDLQQTTAQNAATAQQDLATAQKTLADAQKKRSAMNYPHTTDQLVIEKAQTDYLLAKQAYQDALKQYNKVANKKLTNLQRVNALNNLVAAEQKMNTAFATYNWYLLPYTANDIAQADAAVAVAQASVNQAQTSYDNLKNGPDAAAVAVAEANLADAQRAYDRVKNGPNPDDVAAAQAAVDAAQATLDQIHLLAPFAGKVTSLDVKLGDLVNSGTQAFRIDDTSSIFVDLLVSEIDVNSLQVGQPATLTFDAIPNKDYNGKVTEIGAVGTVSQGVVNYPVTVQIMNPDEALKPGMTAAVDVATAEHDNVLMVPNQAIRATGGQRNVTVLFEGQQFTIPVTVGLNNGTMSEVSSNQLKEGDTVVINSTASSTANRNGTQGGFRGPGGGGFFIGP
jgi:HlyD family secretion protein